MNLLKILMRIAFFASILVLVVSQVVDSLAPPQSIQACLFVFVGVVLFLEIYSIVRYGYDPLNLFYPERVHESIVVPVSSDLGELILEEDEMRGGVRPPYEYRAGMKLSLHQNYLIVRGSEQVDSRCAMLIPLADVARVLHRRELVIVGLADVIEVHYGASSTPLRFFPLIAADWMDAFRSLLGGTIVSDSS